MKKLLLLLCAIPICSLNAQEIKSEESTSNRIATISLSSLVSLAGGLGGGFVGFGVGAGVEEATGSTCSGSDFCIGAGPLIGFSIGYPMGASWALYAIHHQSYAKTRFSTAFMWTLVGIGLGGAGAIATSGNPLISSSIFVGMAHVFPAIMLSF